MDSGYSSGNPGQGYNQPPGYNQPGPYPPQQQPPYPPQNQYGQNYSQYPHGPQYPGGQNYGPDPNYPQGPHYGYGPQPGMNQPPTYNPPPGGYQNREIPDTAHIHPLFQEPSNTQCKVCKKYTGGAPSYVCHQCELVLCYDCFNNIFYGNKQKQVHPHPLTLRVRPSWRCDICKRTFRGTASFYCRGCDFDACSNCYVGY